MCECLCWMTLDAGEKVSCRRNIFDGMTFSAECFCGCKRCQQECSYVSRVSRGLTWERGGRGSRWRYNFETLCESCRGRTGLLGTVQGRRHGPKNSEPIALAHFNGTTSEDWPWIADAVHGLPPHTKLLPQDRWVKYISRHTSEGTIMIQFSVYKIELIIQWT